MKLRTKLKVKLWLLRAALVVSIASALIWTVPILHGDYIAGLTGIALSYILAILAAGFSYATKWDLENINLLIDEEVKLITGEFFNALTDKKIDDDLAKHTSSFERVIDRQRKDCMSKMNKEECKEQIQQDLMCFLDGMGDDVLDRVCEIVVENFAKMENNGHLHQWIREGLKDREHLERLIDKGTMPPAHPHPIGWRYAETSTEDPPFASTDGEGIKVNPRKLQDYLEG